MSFQAKDFWGRLFWTVALAAVSFGIAYLTGVDEVWGLAILAGLQVIKNVAAQQVGDLGTSGFTEPTLDQVAQAGLEDEPVEDIEWDDPEAVK